MVFILPRDPAPPAGFGSDGNPYSAGAAAAGAGGGAGTGYGAPGVGADLSRVPAFLTPGLELYAALYAGQMFESRRTVTGTGGVGDDLRKTFGTRKEKKDRVVSTLAYLRDFQQNTSDEELRDWALRLAVAGYAPASIDTLEKAKEFAIQAPRNLVFQLHEQFVSEAAQLFQYAQQFGGKKLTPEQYLEQQIKYRTLGRLGDLEDVTFNNADSLISQYGDLLSTGVGQDEPFSGKKTQTATSKSVDLMSPQDARGLVRGLLHQELGRDPTQAEYEDFVAALHAAQKRNPTVTTTTSTGTYEEGELVDTQTSSTSRGGITATGLQQAAFEKLRKTPAWEEWQAVGVYAPALMAALDAPVQGV